MRAWASFLVCSFLAACTSVQVYSPQTLRGADPSGSVKGLQELIADGQPLTLVLVHGVGDHCAGFALGDEADSAVQSSAWLSDDSMKKLRLSAIAGSEKTSAITANEIRVGGPADAGVPVVFVRERDYLLTLSQGDPRAVHAVEVTWSPLTRWIKNTLLGYDDTRLSMSGPLGVEPCKLSPDNLDPRWFEPPPRAVVNAYLKWGVLDRSLADAMIYTGSYGEAMQRAMAAALCRVVRGAQDSGRCAWPTADAVHDQGRFLFVTHSLGSRILYDTLQNLRGMQDPATKARYPNMFDDAYVQAARPVVESVVDQSTGIYMMANQLAMLGLANVPTNASFGIVRPFEAGSAGAPTAPPGASAALRQSVVEADALKNLIAFRNRPDNGTRIARPMVIVSFNDTNDLLTWHMAPWYAEQNTGVEVADVFVTNATRWLGVFEWPQTAHSGYFSNPSVWTVMFCGAAQGKPKNC